jgi:uncharacterized protein YebE (UPF0316 family)
MHPRAQALLSAIVIASVWYGRLPAPAGVLASAPLPAWLTAGIILALQTGNITLDTVRTLSVARGRRAISWLTGFGQSLLFVLAIASVLQNLHQPWNLLAYAAGFATGNVLGITIENRLAPGHSLLRIISRGRGPEIAQSLRNAGRGVTELSGRGHDGAVSVLMCHVPRRQVGLVRQTVNGMDAEAFMTAEDVRQIAGGWRA